MLINLQLKNVDYDKTILYWNVETEINENLHSFLYSVELSESSNGPWTALFEDPIHAYGFVDKMTQRGMVNQRIYYRIKAINIADGSESYSEPICVSEEETNYLTQFISKQENLQLRRYNGQECLHFSRKKFGDRCKECYDKVARKCIKPNCSLCFGTTYQSGYFYPTKIYVNLDPQAKVIDKHENGVSENYSLGGWTSNEAIIEADDLLIFLKKPSQRCIVSQVTPTSLNGATVRQILGLTELKADHPTQKIKVDIEAYSLDEFNVFRREWMF